MLMRMSHQFANQSFFFSHRVLKSETILINCRTHAFPFAESENPESPEHDPFPYPLGSQRGKSSKA